MAKGKTLAFSGWMLAAAGAGIVSVPIAEPDNDAAIGIGVAGAALAIGGLVLALAGRRRVKHPERFARRHPFALAPTSVRGRPGVSLALRF